MVLRTVRREAGPQKRLPKALKVMLAQGDSQGRVHRDQMVLVMVRREAGPRERRPKTLQGELENNSRNPRDLVKEL